MPFDELILVLYAFIFLCGEISKVTYMIYIIIIEFTDNIFDTAIIVVHCPMVVLKLDCTCTTEQYFMNNGLVTVWPDH